MKAKKPSVAKRIAESRELDAQVDAALEQCNRSGENQFVQDYEEMLKLNRRLIRRLRTALLAKEVPDSRSIYALSTLMSQQREVISDLRTMTDMSQQVSQIDEQVLQTLVKFIGQIMIDSFYQTRKLISNTADRKQVQFALQQHKDITTAQTQALQACYEQVQPVLMQILGQT